MSTSFLQTAACHQMAKSRGETYYRIIDEDFDPVRDTNTLTVKTEGGTKLVIISRTAYYARPIPQRGLSLHTFLHMTRLVGVRIRPLMLGLLRLKMEGGMSISLVRDLAGFEGQEFVNTVEAAINAIYSNIPHNPMVRTIRNVPDTEQCVICLQTKAESPTHHWSAATGCNRHIFHTACIQDWHGGSCPMCRAMLLRHA